VARNAVGSLAVMVSANAAQFDRTMTKVVTDVNRLHSRIKPADLTQFTSVDSLNKQIAGMKSPMVGGGRGGLLGSALGGAGGLAGAAAGLGAVASAGWAVDKVLKQIEDKSKVMNAAKAFGASPEAMSGLMGMLGRMGGDFKENLEGLTQFGRRVRDAYAGIGEESARLFDGLSVQAKDIINLPIDQQFYKVLGAIRQLPQHLQMSKLELLGGTDSMKQWLPMLSYSVAELKEIDRKTRMTAVELGYAAAAQKSIAEATQAWNKAWDKLAVAVAPVVKGLAEEIPPALDSLAEKMAPAETTAIVMGTVFAQMRDDVGEIVSFFGKIGGSSLIKNQPIANIASAYLGRAGKKEGGRAESFRTWVEGMRAKPGDPLYFGPGDFGADAAERRRMAARDAVSNRPLDPRISGFGDSIRGKFSGVKPQKDEWESLFGSVKMSPFEQFQNTRRLVGMGVADQPANAALGNQILANAFMELESSLDKITNDIPAAVQAGTAEAESAISRAMLSDPSNQGIDRVADILQRAEEREKKQARDIGRIADELAGKDPVKVVKIGG
jgi:hypothetical protein